MIVKQLTAPESTKAMTAPATIRQDPASALPFLPDMLSTMDDEGRLTQIEVRFAEQIAMAVWLRKITDEAARDTLGLYALAGRRDKPDRKSVV